MNPILTIAIPTYNRVDKLKKCIELVMKEIQDRPIEVMVSDNASTDNTQQVMEEIQKEYPQIMYYRNKENVGADRNFLNCYEKAKGDYIWLIGDDDMLLPNAIDTILEALEEKPVFLHLNTSNLVSSEPLRYNNTRISEQGIIKYMDKNEFFEEMGIFVTFLSALVLKTDYVRQINHKEKYIGTYFIQSHIALATLKHEGLYLINTTNCLAASGNNTVSYDLYHVWGKQYKELLYTTGLESGIDEKVIRQVHCLNLKTNIKDFVIHFRKTCKNEAEWNKDDILQSVEMYPKLKKMYKKIIYMPVWQLKINHFLAKVKYKIGTVLK